MRSTVHMILPLLALVLCLSACRTAPSEVMKARIISRGGPTLAVFTLYEEIPFALSPGPDAGKHTFVRFINLR